MHNTIKIIHFILYHTITKSKQLFRYLFRFYELFVDFDGISERIADPIISMAPNIE